MHVTKQLMAAIDLHSIFIFHTMEVNGCCQFVNLSFEKQYIFLAWNRCRVDRPVPQFNEFDLVVSTPLTSHDLKTVNMLIAIWFSPNYFDSFNITNCVYGTICQNQFVCIRPLNCCLFNFCVLLSFQGKTSLHESASMFFAFLELTRTGAITGLFPDTILGWGWMEMIFRDELPGLWTQECCFCPSEAVADQWMESFAHPSLQNPAAALPTS